MGRWSYLDGGAVGEGIGVGDAELDDVGAGVVEDLERLLGGVEVGIARADEGHEGALAALLERGEGVADGDGLDRLGGGGADRGRRAGDRGAARDGARARAGGDARARQGGDGGEGGGHRCWFRVRVGGSEDEARKRPCRVGARRVERASAGA